MLALYSSLAGDEGRSFKHYSPQVALAIGSHAEQRFDSTGGAEPAV